MSKFVAAVAVVHFLLDSGPRGFGARRPGRLGRDRGARADALRGYKQLKFMLTNVSICD